MPFRGLHLSDHKPDSQSDWPQGSYLERETGLEPATLALARRCSTTELLPHTSSESISGGSQPGQRTPFFLPQPGFNQAQYRIRAQGRVDLQLRVVNWLKMLL